MAELVINKGDPEELTLKDIEFPIYRKYKDIVYQFLSMTTEAQAELQIAITEGEEYTMSLFPNAKYYSGDGMDYILGMGEHECTKEEFDAAAEKVVDKILKATSDLRS